MMTSGSRLGAALRQMAIALICFTSFVAADAATLSPDLQSHLASDDFVSTRVIIQVHDAADAAQVLRDMHGVGDDARLFAGIGMISVEVDAEQLDAWARHADVRVISGERVVTQEQATLLSLLERTTGAADVRGAFGYDGTGVGVAVLDSGLQTNHVDVRNASTTGIVGNGSDGYGHGQHVAGIISGIGQGSAQKGKNYTGVAPGAHVVSVKVLDDSGAGTLTDLLAGIAWVFNNAASNGIDVVNLSLGAPSVESYKSDPICAALDSLIDSGLVVVSSAGNSGKGPDGQKAYGTITSPGICPRVITVGASSDQGTPERSDDRVANYSSRGPTRGFDIDTGKYDHLLKPDLVAPGTGIWSTSSDRS